ncbi:PilZ domain-containing protein [Desulfoplanes formicivorans]|uniref:Type IV pilus assembly PilZ n=1 Tax=Desulfoplanes formicivorans TaxID=1592317 RepID=A0A194AII3_9BACT|nr:PilZ domain-containing protein [Desulfoplanes formicivorans]GAU09133.1 type IV pilus assembly PilZ [Desulfoplanes formicivorans]
MRTNDFTIEYTPSSQRKTLRVTPRGQLSIRLGPSGQLFPIRNISAGGISIAKNSQDAPKIAPNMILEIAIIQNGKVLIDKVDMQCVHITPSSLGGAFINLPPRTEILLDKLILEIQKQQINEKQRSHYCDTQKT